MLLSHALRAINKPTGISYVGGRVGAFAGSPNDVTLINALNSLTGGIASNPSPNDLVIVWFGTGSDTDRNLIISGYTEITELYANKSFDVNLVVGYKFMGATPDSSVTFTGGTGGDAGGSQGDADAGAYVIQVFRNIDQTTPIDVTSTTATSTTTARPNPAAITPTTSGAWIIAGGAGAHNGGATPTFTGSGLTNFLTISSNDTNDVLIGAGHYRTWTSGSYDPSQFTLSGLTDSTNFSSAAVTIALRPAVPS